MNEVQMVNEYGPEGPELSGEARQAARARLLAEIPSATGVTAGFGGRGSLFARLPGRSGTGAGRWLVTHLVPVAGLAALVAVAVVVTLATTANHSGRPSATASQGSQPASQGKIKLVAVTAPEFPYTLPGLGTPSFTADPGGPMMAVYSAPDGSDVVLTGGSARPRQRLRGERDVTVDGRQGRIVTISDGGSGAGGAVQLTWERQPGRWVTIVGSGRYASEDAVLRLAHQVVDQPQSVDLKVTIGLVPDGWVLGGFKSGGSILTYQDPATPDISLSAQWTPQPEAPADSDVEGFESSETVMVNGRPAHLVRATQFWRLTATLPDGSGFMMLAPRAFSTDQVVAVAGSVRINHG